MIGWRVGWMVSRAELAPSLALVHIYNGVVTSGFGQVGAAAALRVGDGDVRAAVAEWERRHDELVRQCDGLPLVPAHGGWSALFDAQACGFSPSELSERLLDHKVAATPMTDAWGGAIATRYLRLVFSNESVERLALFGDRLRAPCPSVIHVTNPRTVKRHSRTLAQQPAPQSTAHVLRDANRT
jgi:aspartate/methionine/tyrosine aminotransferase